MHEPWSMQAAVDEVFSLGPEIAQQLADVLRRRGARAGDVPLVSEVAVSPILVKSEQTRELDRLGRALHVVLRESVAAFGEDPRRLRSLMPTPRGILRTASRFDRSLAQFAAQAAPAFVAHPSAHAPDLLVRARPDVLVTAGRLRIVEINVGNMLSAVMDEIAQAFTSVPQLAAIVEGTRGADCSAELAGALLRRHRMRFGDVPASVGRAYHPAARSNDSDALAAAFEALGVAVHDVGPGSLRYDGEHLLAGAVPISILVEECTATPTTLLRFGTAARIAYKLHRWRAFRAGAAILFPSPHEAVFNKAFLALLSEGEAMEELVDPEALGQLREYLAWTRVTRPGRTRDVDGRSADMRELAHERQDELVLKPIVGHTAIGVTLGDAVTPAVWRRAVDDALRARDSVLQERLRPAPMEIVPVAPFARVTALADFCPVFIDGRTVAVFSRFTLEGELTHFIHHEGGHGLVPVFLRRG